MRKVFIILFIVLLVLVVIGAVLVSKYGSGVEPAVRDVPADISDIISKHNELPPGQNDTEFPLTIPDGFKIEVLAKVPDARVMVMDHNGNIWVSSPKNDALYLITMKEGRADRTERVFANHTFEGPHGLAFDPKNPQRLYIANEDSIESVMTGSENSAFEKIVDLPSGGRHTTRTLIFGSDGQLYVSIGSTCDVCREQNDKHATIMRVNLDKKVLEPYAKGLRNSVFMAVNPFDGSLWATEMGRDMLGNTTPPDEINIIQEGKNYGWPACYGKNIHDSAFDKNVYIRNPCMEPFETPSHIDFPAHVAPLGLAFIPEAGWPDGYGNSLLVAEHGSWNRQPPVGYKIIQILLDDKGNKLEERDFITGWLTKDNRALGRPVDIIAQPGGVMYISDDKAGVIYKVSTQIK